MKEQLNTFAVCHITRFRRPRQAILLLKLATSNKNNNKYYRYYNNSKKITIM